MCSLSKLAVTFEKNKLKSRYSCKKSVVSTFGAFKKTIKNNNNLKKNVAQ